MKDIIKHNNLYIVSEANTFIDNINKMCPLEKAFTYTELKNLYADYLDKKYPNEREFPAIDGLDGCDERDVIDQIESELDIKLLSYNQFKENTDNLINEIVDFFVFIHENREKDAYWFQSYFEKRNRLPFEFDGDLMDINPDEKALILATLNFDENGKVLKSVGEISENELFEDTYVAESKTYDYEKIINCFNNKAELFNEEQNEARQLCGVVKNISLTKATELIGALMYHLEQYGEDVSGQEICEWITKADGQFIDLITTSLGDYNQHEVSLSYDLKNQRYIHKIWNENVNDLIYTDNNDFYSLDDFISDLHYASYEDLLFDFTGVLEKIYGDNWLKVEDKEFKIFDSFIKSKKCLDTNNKISPINRAKAASPLMTTKPKNITKNER